MLRRISPLRKYIAGHRLESILHAHEEDDALAMSRHTPTVPLAREAIGTPTGGYSSASQTVNILFNSYGRYHTTKQAWGIYYTHIRADAVGTC